MKTKSWMLLVMVMLVILTGIGFLQLNDIKSPKGVSSVPRFYNGKALLSISQLSKRNLTLNVLKTSHFQENSGTETLFPHPFLGRAVNHFDAPTESPHLLSKEMFKIVRISQNEDIIARGKWQMKQVSKFCRKYGNVLSLGALKPSLRTKLFRHLIFDDNKKFIFCFLPKAGCTNLRRLVFILQGILSEETAKLTSISEEEYLTPALNKVSFINLTLIAADKTRMLKHYYKFMMIRNPLERLLSGYRDKIEPLLQADYSVTSNRSLLKDNVIPKNMKFFEAHRRWIFSKYRPLDLLKWMNSRGSYNIQLTFSDFVQWIISSDDNSLNEHFSSILSNAHPCTIRYNFYANFKNYSREVRLLIKRLDTNPNFFTDHNSHKSWDETKSVMKMYYSQLSSELKYRLFKKMYKELDFYYHLYPEDQWSHVELLRVNEPILVQV